MKPCNRVTALDMKDIVLCTYGSSKCFEPLIQTIPYMA